MTQHSTHHIQPRGRVNPAYGLSAHHVDPSRREFLVNTGRLAAAAFTTGAIGFDSLVGSSLAAVPMKGGQVKSVDLRHRVNEAADMREAAAIDEKQLGVFSHPTNGDEERYPNRIGNFSKTLPHDAFGEVDPNAYNALLAALASGRFEDFEAIPAGGTRKILNPLGGLAFNMEGPDSPATQLVTIPPAFASQEMGAQAAEIYWMAACRDVPFQDYTFDPAIADAVADLNAFPGYQGPRPVTPENLFRYDYPDALVGPMVSQILLREFRFDGMPLDGKTRVPLPVIGGAGYDFLTNFDEWLVRQNGVPADRSDPDFSEQFDPVLRYPRSVRDLGRVASQDAIYSAYFRAALILFGISELDDGNPYKTSVRQSAFATLGGSDLLRLIGTVHKGERQTWYDKWQVHRYPRPEAFGGAVHLTRTGAKDYPVDPQLLSSPVLDRIFEINRINNQRRHRGNQGSYLLPQQSANGSPAHPSAPAGHAFSAGCCITILKAWFKEDEPFPQPHYEITPEGDRVEVPGGIPGLTIGGELNKLAHNMSAGRDMFGVHWRVADNLTGNFQGEEVAIRLLREAQVTYPEAGFGGFSLTKFNGQTVNV